MDSRRGVFGGASVKKWSRLAPRWFREASASERDVMLIEAVIVGLLFLYAVVSAVLVKAGMP